MESEQRIGQLAEGQVPFGGGRNEPPDRAPVAAHPPPQTEPGSVQSSGGDDERLGVTGTIGGDIFSAGIAGNATVEATDQHAEPDGDDLAGEIVDVAKLEEERRARYGAGSRERQREWYHELKQGVARGDEAACHRLERLQQQNREAQRRWRKNHPDKVRENNRRYYKPQRKARE